MFGLQLQCSYDVCFIALPNLNSKTHVSGPQFNCPLVFCTDKGPYLLPYPLAFQIISVERSPGLHSLLI